jgi:hypothetical protein
MSSWQSSESRSAVIPSCFSDKHFSTHAIITRQGKLFKCSIYMSSKRISFNCTSVSSRFSVIAVSQSHIIAEVQSVSQQVSHSVSESVRLGFEPLNETHGHILAFRENFVFVCRGASTLRGGQVCHIKGSESLSVSCVCFYIILITRFFFFVYNVFYYFCLLDFYIFRFYFFIIYKSSLYMLSLSVRALCSRLCLHYILTAV